MAGAAALHAEDMAFTQYREPGILMWRDFGLQVRCASTAVDAFHRVGDNPRVVVPHPTFTFSKVPCFAVFSNPIMYLGRCIFVENTF